MGGFIRANADLLFPNQYDQDKTEKLITPGRVLPYISYVGMCRPIG